MPLWAPSRDWDGQDAFLVGGGSSLRGFDFSLLKGRNVIGCNDAWHLGEEIVSICLFGDTSWWEKNKQDLKSFKGRVVSCAPTCLTLKLDWLWQMKRVKDGLHDGDTLGWNQSTGAAAMNLAMLLGAHRIYLLGYDLSVQGGKFHWHDYNKKKLNTEPFVRFTRGFYSIASSLHRFPQVRVYNVTDGSSKLPVFDRITFADFLSELLPSPALSGSSPRLVANETLGPDRASLSEACV